MAVSLSPSFRGVNVKGWVITLLLAGLITWLLYTPGANPTSLYWLGTILGERLSAPQAVCVALTLAGVVVVALPGTRPANREEPEAHSPGR